MTYQHKEIRKNEHDVCDGNVFHTPNPLQFKFVIFVLVLSHIHTDDASGGSLVPTETEAPWKSLVKCFSTNFLKLYLTGATHMYQKYQWRKKIPRNVSENTLFIYQEKCKSLAFRWIEIMIYVKIVYKLYAVAQKPCDKMTIV